MLWVFTKSASEALLVKTHNMFSWRKKNKKKKTKKKKTTTKQMYIYIYGLSCSKLQKLKKVVIQCDIKMSILIYGKYIDIFLLKTE